MKTGDNIHYAGFPKVRKKRYRVTFFSGVSPLKAAILVDVSDIVMLFPYIDEFRRLNSDFKTRKARIECLGTC